MRIDQDDVDFEINRIRRNKGSWHSMSNEDLADSLFPFIKREFPKARMIKIGISQHIFITKRAENALMETLKKNKKKYEKMLLELDSAIREIQGDSENGKMRSKGSAALMEDIKTIKRPCQACVKVKNGDKFKVRDDNGCIQTITFISYCPYCGRYLQEQTVRSASS